MTVIRLTTTQGDIDITLNEDKAPITCQNFLTYVNSGFYNGTIFHRVIKNFMIQGGGFTASMEQKKTESPIQNEADNGLKNLTGTIAMARTMDPHSATAQFFINLVDNDFLDHKNKTPQGWGYAVFGQVTKGLDIVKAIGDVETGRVAGMQDVPKDSIVISKAEVLEDK